MISNEHGIVPEGSFGKDLMRDLCLLVAPVLRPIHRQNSLVPLLRRRSFRLAGLSS